MMLMLSLSLVVFYGTNSLNFHSLYFSITSTLITGGIMMAVVVV